ncbi:jg25265 [Pararge aegeria aegeria]|uniref:Jg25265 protein n=1 Tax=Pararge aegeria aegeria TaxID=348720 RepID=A0A8S4R037_9NEOP|nr:jg25265 [Pararge aegeria aegeria]
MCSPFMRLETANFLTNFIRLQIGEKNRVYINHVSSSHTEISNEFLVKYSRALLFIGRTLDTHMIVAMDAFWTPQFGLPNIGPKVISP